MLAGVPLGGVEVAGAFDGVGEVVPPAPAGAGFVPDGLTTGVFLGFGMLEPTPLVCDLALCRIMCAVRICCC